MKKLIIIFTTLCLIFSNYDSKEFTLKDYFKGEYTVYTSSSIDSSSINLGFAYMTNSDKDVRRVKVVGESIKIENFEPIAGLKTLKAKVVATENLDNGATVIYAYTNLIKDSVKIANNDVNLQIAHYDEYTVIGWPLILGSF